MFTYYSVIRKNHLQTWHKSDEGAYPRILLEIMMSQQNQQNEIQLPITTEEMALYQLHHNPPRRRPDNSWQWLAELTVNEHGLMRQDCRCRVCVRWRGSR